MQPNEWHDIWWGPLTGKMGWFLPALFVATMLCALLKRVPMPLLFVAAVLIAHYWPERGIPSIDRSLQELPFMVAGFWMGERYAVIKRVPVWLAWVLVPVLATVVVMIGPTFSPFWTYVPDGLVGTLMLLLLAHAMGSSAAGRFFAWIGIASLSVFLFAPFGQGISRDILVLAHVQNPWVHLVIPTIVSTLPPVWLYQNRGRLHFDWAFVWPWSEQALQRSSKA